MDLNQEIERKFLINTLPSQYKAGKRKYLQQGYLFSESEKELRIRKSDLSYTLTVKGGNGLVRSEVELPISKEQFDTLWPMTLGKRLTKERIEIPYGKLTIELDIYTDSHAPLMVAEVEFESKEESESFVPPAFFGKEITGESFYKNSVLVQ